MKKNKKQKMGKGKMVGLSGFTGDFSKMPADEADYMRECLQRDIKGDMLMNPRKYHSKELITKTYKGEKR